MDDLFNQLMGNMGGFRSESRRYMINGREVTLLESRKPMPRPMPLSKKLAERDIQKVIMH